MAELSEADKKVLLGPDYKEKEQRRSAHARGGAGAVADEKGDPFLGVCAFTAIVALLIFVGDVFRPAASRGHSVQIAAIAVFVVSLAVVVWRLQRGKVAKAGKATASAR